MLSPPALQFKGTGWYVTDYGRNGKSSASNGTTHSHKDKSESKAETKTEAKSESKSDSKAPAASK